MRQSRAIFPIRKEDAPLSVRPTEKKTKFRDPIEAGFSLACVKTPPGSCEDGRHRAEEDEAPQRARRGRLPLRADVPPRSEFNGRARASQSR